MRLREALAPLGEREFRLLFVGRLVSFVGSAVAPVALAFAVIDDLDGSATQLGLVLAAGWVPQIFFVLVGGVIADRLPRHLVLIGSNAVSGATQVAVAVLLLTGSAELWQLAVAQVVRGAATAFFFPASTGIVPQTVSGGRLQQANALLRMTNTFSFIFGSALGGIAVAAAGSGWAIAFDGATYLASAAVLAFMHIEGTSEGHSSFVNELAEGWTEFRSRTWVWVIVAAAAVGNMVWAGAFTTLGPIVANDQLGGAAAWGAILAVQAVGLLVGGLVALRFHPQRPLLVAQVAVLAIALTLGSLAAGLPAPAVAFAAALGGIGIELFGVYWDTALQRHIPPRALSRVSSYDALGSFVFIPVGLALVGPVADAIGVTATLWGATAIFVAAQAAALLSREVRGLRDDSPVLEPAASTA